MIKVITYGTYDLLHEGHIKLLERAKAMGDYLIVGVTADGYDLARGKINVQQSLIERIEAVKSTGLADKIIVEEYEGQKIDDIRKYNIDIFTVGSDWIGKFDYLRDYCEVVYLDRTQGISSTMLRSNIRQIKIGIIGDNILANKFYSECKFVNGVVVSGILTENINAITPELSRLRFNTFNELLEASDAVYIASIPESHYYQASEAIKHGLHVICEAPITLFVEEFQKLLDLAKRNKVVLMEGIKTAYSLAFSRLMLLVKGGIIGEVISIDSTCTSLIKNITPFTWSSICYWGPTAMLPITDIFGCDYCSSMIVTKRNNKWFDLFTQVTLVYPHGVGTLKVAQGVKSEGELIISGTKGYVYVPAPWWKTDYFEIRYEDPTKNKRYFYKLDGEGIRNEIRSFYQLIHGNSEYCQVSPSQSEAIIKIIETSIDNTIII